MQVVIQRAGRLPRKEHAGALLEAIAVLDPFVRADDDLGRINAVLVILERHSRSLSQPEQPQR